MYKVKLETSCNAAEKNHTVLSFAKILEVSVEVPGESGREFHNLAAEYENECRP